MLKWSIIIVFALMLVSLSVSLKTLFKQVDSPSLATWYALSIRLGLALLLFTLIFYGFLSGKLTPNAPWESAQIEEKLPPKSQIFRV